MFLPIKTNDVVEHQDKRFVVKGVQLTGDGPILTLLAIRTDIPTVVHASEVSFVDKNETVKRAKSVGIDAIKAQQNFTKQNSNTVEVPEGMTIQEAQRILKLYAK